MCEGHVKGSHEAIKFESTFLCAKYQCAKIESELENYDANEF